MADKSDILKLYGDFCRFLQTAETNSFYSFFSNTVQSAASTVSVFEKYIDRKIDVRWLEAIENVIIPLDNIIRNPKTFIKRDEDIIPIAQARDIGPESVRHLSQHTNMIESVRNGRVMPSRILIVNKEDSIDTYENRFIHTLIKLTSYFLDKRMSVLMKDNRVSDLFDYNLDGNCRVGVDNFSYHMNMHLEAPHEEAKDENLIEQDVSKMTPMQRVERLRKIFYNFNGSSFSRSLNDTPAVHPPLVMTNVLLKNPNFIKAVELWNFLNSYTDAGYTTEYVEQYRTPSGTDKSELFSLVMLEYVIMKKQCRQIENVSISEETPAESEISAPNIIKKSVDQLCDTFDLSVDEIRKIYETELRKKEKKRAAEFTKATGIFERAIAFEKEAGRQNEIARHERIIEEIKRRLMLAEQDAQQLEAIKKKEKDDAQKSSENTGFAGKYRYSFRSRLILGQMPVQSYYSAIKNSLLSYEGVKASMTWGYERFSIGNKTLCKISGREKSLTLTISVNPERYADTKYRVKDLRNNKKDASCQTGFTIRSERNVQYAVEMIADLMRERNIRQNDIPSVDYSEEYRTVEEMLRMTPPLVKLIEKSNEIDESEKSPLIYEAAFENENVIIPEQLDEDDEIKDESEAEEEDIVEKEDIIEEENIVEEKDIVEEECITETATAPNVPQSRRNPKSGRRRLGRKKKKKLKKRININIQKTNKPKTN